MKSRLMYIEIKSGFSDDGPAWIGRASFSKKGRTIYFNGQAFQGGRIGGDHIELESRDVYWISGIKKEELPKSKFEIVELNKTPPKELANEILNQKI